MKEVYPSFLCLQIFRELLCDGDSVTLLRDMCYRITVGHKVCVTCCNVTAWPSCSSHRVATVPRLTPREEQVSVLSM